jgi:hypothetical protein
MSPNVDRATPLAWLRPCWQRHRWWGFVPGMLDAKEPNGIWTLIGGRIAIEEISNCLIEVALSVFRCVEERGALGLW